jgi:hypothetical protein
MDVAATAIILQEQQQLYLSTQHNAVGSMHGFMLCFSAPCT